MANKLLIVGSLLAIWLASKLVVVLSPHNPWRELQCWSLQFVDSWLIIFGIYSVRPHFQECVRTLISEFPKGSSWETSLDIVELTPQNMSEFFANRKDALEVPWVIRGFLAQKDTDFDINKYKDIEYFETHVNRSKTYNFESVGGAETLPLGEALDRMKDGEGLYLKFNRDFTNNEDEVRNAVDKATETLIKMGGPVVNYALRDAIKVTFLTYGSQMRTKIHNAMSANWFYQIAGMKDWKLYEPHQSIYLQPFNFPNAIASGSNFDTSFAGGPKYLSFRTYPGDFLFFPSFWLHEVDNVGPGPKLAVGLRPSLSATAEMWKTAVIPFYEYPRSTTGVAMCHLGPSVGIIFDNIWTRVKTNVVMKVYGLTEAEAKSSFEEIDRGRGRDWWVKNIKSKEFQEATKGNVATKNDEEMF